MTAQQPNIELALQQEHARRQQPKRLPSLTATTRTFERIADDRYRLTVPELAVTLEIDRLRRSSGELIGELSAVCKLLGTLSPDSALSIADLNLSSARARTDRAKLLAVRANTKDQVDWHGIVEQFCQSVLEADRAGSPAVDLRTIERPAADTEILIEGLPLLRRHPAVLFGDGGTAKSYLALFLAGRLSEQGVRVAMFDWELAGEDHRDRLERLFPDGMPKILYAKCERPLVYEADRLRRIVRDASVEYTIFDSVAFACDGPPEAAELAGRYFRAARQIGGGSLHVAHVSKAEGADKRSFGSAFWHNGARSTWFVQLAEGSADSEKIQIGLFNRKANLGRLRQPVGYRIEFGEELTTFRRSDVADIAATPSLATQLSTRQRMAHLLRKGAMTAEAIAEEIDARVDTVERTLRRNKGQFVVLQGGRIGLAAESNLQ
jgi:hypothetical protein